MINYSFAFYLLAIRIRCRVIDQYFTFIGFQAKPKPKLRPKPKPKPELKLKPKPSKTSN